MVVAMGAFLAMIVIALGGNVVGASFVEQIKEITQELSLIYLELLFVTALATFFSTFFDTSLKCTFHAGYLARRASRGVASGVRQTNSKSAYRSGSRRDLLLPA